MAGISGVGNQSIFAASGMDLDAMGLEEMIMYVQQKRAESCQTLLEGQVKAVQGRTNEINRLNGIMGKLNEATAEMAAAKEDTAKVSDYATAVTKITEASKMGPEAEQPGLSPAAKESKLAELVIQCRGWFPTMSESGIKFQAGVKLENYNNNLIAQGITHVGTTTDSTVANLTTGTKAELSAAITNLKTQIDSLNNSQQTDMLRLQGLTTKYNECFDTMSNVMKKFDGSRSGIVGNLR